MKSLQHQPVSGFWALRGSDDRGIGFSFFQQTSRWPQRSEFYFLFTVCCFVCFQEVNLGLPSYISSKHQTQRISCLSASHIWSCFWFGQHTLPDTFCPSQQFQLVTPYGVIRTPVRPCHPLPCFFALSVSFPRNHVPHPSSHLLPDPILAPQASVSSVASFSHWSQVNYFSCNRYTFLLLNLLPHMQASVSSSRELVPWTLAPLRRLLSIISETKNNYSIKFWMSKWKWSMAAHWLYIIPVSFIFDRLCSCV